MTAPDSTPPRVGWIGTGHMGAAMARRIAAAGVELAAWNRTRAKAEPLTEVGATVVDAVTDLADRDVVFSMVSASKDLEQVMLGEGGLLTGGRVPQVIVDCSTVSTETSAAVRAAAEEKGAAFLASPVSGNGKVVRAGKLSICVSGPEEAFLEVRPLLELLGRSVTYVGDGELARLVKICHNVFLGVVAQSMAEITVLAEQGGVSRAAFLDFLNHSVMGSLFTTYKTPAYVTLDYTPTFTPVLLRKDLDLGLAAANEHGVPMPLAAATRQLVQAAIGHGHAAEDFAALLSMQAAASGLELKPENVEVDDGLTPEN